MKPGGTAIDISQYLPAPPTREVRRTITDRLREPVPWNLSPYIDHWSPSSFDMADRCWYQWQQRYIKKRKVAPAEAPVLGTSVHGSILDHNFAQKISSHEDLPLEVVLERYMDEGFVATVLAEQEKAGEEIQWDTSPEDARRRGYQIIAAYHTQVSPRIQPLKVETAISVDFGLPVPVEGRFDLEREASTIDLKTGKRKQSKPKESWRIQAAVYGEAVGKPVEFHSLSATTATNAATIVTPLESEDLLLAPKEFERAQMRRSLHAISAMACVLMDIYGPDEDWPTLGRFHTWACDYCGFRPSCPAWREN